MSDTDSAYLVDIPCSISAVHGDVVEIATEDGATFSIGQSAFSVVPAVGTLFQLRLISREAAQLDREALSRALLNTILQDEGGAER